MGYRIEIKHTCLDCYEKYDGKLEKNTCPKCGSFRYDFDVRESHSFNSHPIKRIKNDDDIASDPAWRDSDNQGIDLG